MRPQLYPWEEWFGQPTFQLFVGEHYVCSQNSMTTQIRNEARKRKRFVSITDHGVGLSVKVFRKRQLKPKGSKAR